MATREMIIRKVRELANSRYPDAEIYLYGSQARGDAKPFSDWDLLVLLNAKLIPFEVETRIMDEFYEIELETGEVISPLIYPKETWENRHSHTPLFQNIEKEAIRLQ
jgi:uncharacterized protein